MTVAAEACIADQETFFRCDELPRRRPEGLFVRTLFDSARSVLTDDRASGLLADLQVYL